MYLAHDLKTPLTSMIGYINHILDHKVDEEQQQNAIRIAYEKALRLDELIDEFSEILRYDDKVSQLNLSKIDINAKKLSELATIPLGLPYVLIIHGDDEKKADKLLQKYRTVS